MANKEKEYSVTIFFTEGFIKEIKKGKFLECIKVRVYALDREDAIQKAKERFISYDDDDEYRVIDDLRPFVVELFFENDFIKFLKKSKLEDGYKSTIKSLSEDKAYLSTIARFIKYCTTRKE